MPMSTIIDRSQSCPCPERCPKCGRRCFGRIGHSSIRSAGKGYAQPHQCQCGLNWLSGAEAVEVMRAEGRATRAEVIESIKGCAKCVAIVKRLGGLGGLGG